MYEGPRKAARHDRQETLLEHDDAVWKTASIDLVKSPLDSLPLPGGFPRRSPGLNPIGAAINAEIDKRTVRSSRRTRGRRISNEEFREGVQKIAMGDSMKAFARECIVSMPRKVNRFDANGVSQKRPRRRRF